MQETIAFLYVPYEKWACPVAYCANPMNINIHFVLTGNIYLDSFFENMVIYWCKSNQRQILFSIVGRIRVQAAQVARETLG